MTHVYLPLVTAVAVKVTVATVTDRSVPIIASTFYREAGSHGSVVTGGSTILKTNPGNLLTFLKSYHKKLAKWIKNIAYMYIYIQI